jgi:hypothetical protein
MQHFLIVWAHTFLGTRLVCLGSVWLLHQSSRYLLHYCMCIPIATHLRDVDELSELPLILRIGSVGFLWFLCLTYTWDKPNNRVSHARKPRGPRSELQHHEGRVSTKDAQLNSSV